MLDVSELSRYTVTLNSRFPILWILWILWIPDSQILWILGFSDPLLKRKNFIGRDDRFPHCAKSHFKLIMLTYFTSYGIMIIMLTYLLYFIWDYNTYLLTYIIWDYDTYLLTYFVWDPICSLMLSGAPERSLVLPSAPWCTLVLPCAP